jgi:hypothetical protein
MAQVLLFLGLNFTLHRHLSVVLLFQVVVYYFDIMACIERKLAGKDVPASWTDPFRRCNRIMISILNFLSSEILQDVYLTTEDFLFKRHCTIHSKSAPEGKGLYLEYMRVMIRLRGGYVV